jgi:hypothetical protein
MEKARGKVVLQLTVLGVEADSSALVAAVFDSKNKLVGRTDVAKVAASTAAFQDSVTIKTNSRKAQGTAVSVYKVASGTVTEDTFLGTAGFSLEDLAGDQATLPLQDNRGAVTGMTLSVKVTKRELVVTSDLDSERKREAAEKKAALAKAREEWQEKGMKETNAVTVLRTKQEKQLKSRMRTFPTCPWCISVGAPGARL